MSERDFSARSSNVSLLHLTKRFRSLDGSGEVTAVNDINLEIRAGELVTILGPSGCGKTTTLRMIAGFEYPTSGSIFIGGRDVAMIPPNKRGLSMVFQSYALFPHLSIYENVAYGLRVQKLPAQEIRERTERALELMQLTSMAKRFPSQVSGGQQQRIALARAIVIEPSVLLFDEPLSNLDAKLREYMRDELRKLQKRLGITSLYVTHDQSEAMAISDRVVIMKDGWIQQVGTPREIYAFPQSKFVADFMGKANFIKVQVLGIEGEAARIEIEGMRFTVPRAGKAAPRAGSALLVVRPEALRLLPLSSAQGSAALKGRIDRFTYFGNIARYEVSTENAPLLIETYNPEASFVFEEGAEVGIIIDFESARLLPAEEQEQIS
ncbi:ferric transporter subunit; ATP-binding component of ABC transporter; CP4-6 prophage [uncultured spirochete]|uniref:Ferric transporter subunit ATP-binding component of ABC transporter CP4-6 prophage n=1 Tax=uncultured spirochete TaxID=156406 RepID=A0A3P3XN62_9SPIR|nr:ferric transporter subunit; ATP-binding component of ABC transporter; CP4-6 prophage [uncultured spirochete]